MGEEAAALFIKFMFKLCERQGAEQRAFVYYSRNGIEKDYVLNIYAWIAINIKTCSN